MYFKNKSVPPYFMLTHFVFYDIGKVLAPIFKSILQVQSIFFFKQHVSFENGSMSTHKKTKRVE